MAGIGSCAAGAIKAMTLAALPLLVVACSSTGRGEPAKGAGRNGIEDAGVKPSVALSYEHYFLFHDEATTRDAERELIDAGFEVQLQPPGDGVESWSLMATQRAALTAAQLDMLTEQMNQLADRHGGTYDGWGIPIG